MPTYQYACTECGHQLEAVQSFSDPALTECPNCSGKLRKVFSAVGVVFKGSGFYRTDSRSGNGSTGASKPAAKSEGTKSETKPAESKPKSDSSASKPAAKPAGAGASSS